MKIKNAVDCQYNLRIFTVYFPDEGDFVNESKNIANTDLKVSLTNEAIFLFFSKDLGYILILHC